MKNTLSELTKRQQEIVRLMAEGYEDKEIAAKLGIAHGTVGSSLRLLYAHAGVSNRVGLLHHFFEVREKQ